MLAPLAPVLKDWEQFQVDCYLAACFAYRKQVRVPTVLVVEVEALSRQHLPGPLPAPVAMGFQVELRRRLLAAQW